MHPETSWRRLTSHGVKSAEFWLRRLVHSIGRGGVGEEVREGRCWGGKGGEVWGRGKGGGGVGER